MNVDVRLATILPALQEMNGRLEGIAQLLATQTQAIGAGEAAQREIVRLQQQMVHLQEQTVKRPPDHGSTATQNEQLAPYLNAILNGINVLADATQKRAENAQAAGVSPPDVLPNASQNDQVVAYLNAILGGINNLADATQKRAEAGQAAGTAPAEVHFDEITPLLQDIKERLGDLTSGLPASNDGYLDHRREELIDTIYSKMEAHPQGTEQTPRHPSAHSYSNVEEAIPPPSTPRGTRQGTLDQTATRQAPPLPRSVPSAAATKDADSMDAIFAEEAAYLDEQKTHFDKQEKYLEERKEHIAQKKAWYLNLG